MGLSERGSPFMGYHSGVYDRDCGSGAGHAVAAVGYSSDYWIIRNSWGSSWGQHGYIYFKKGANLCGIESHGTIASVSGSSDEVGKGASNSECDTEYAAFLKSFPQKVPSANRKANFCSNFDRIAKHNSGNAQWSMGANEFSDWSDDEQAVLLGWDVTLNDTKLPAFEADPSDAVAAAVDYRSKMPAVKNQKHCGSCWAFSAIDVVDFFGGSHSEEELIDCFGRSCRGNDPQRALQYLSQHGVASESAYGYTAGSGHAGQCKKFQSVASVSNVRAVSGASSIVSALQHQVVSVAFTLSEHGSPFMNYHTGVYDQYCGSGAGHAVAAVGYSSDYWIIRNSWGSGWGRNGGYVYFKKGSNLCGIESRGAIAQVSGSVDEVARVIV